ncbi:ubiquitin carboxyl-terminal hydrolase 4-like isoform X2 [Hydractinia symbiolongicarpus]|uniref:ubiquitin carboxyl-terminal hydrolase 4-like isoform X2 n=1 Tax=Hydractinia symbiolongicarpus TaxID=13093 RepID=UPI002550F5C0|nr:ubiquitin carboxyl-terminal hydrolase 4-like isoform X2 [Hydractinia symbiolongicarpus]
MLSTYFVRNGKLLSMSCFLCIVLFKLVVVMTVTEDNVLCDDQVIINDNTGVDINGDVDLQSDTAENIPSFQEQAKLIKSSIEETLVTGDTWYLLDIGWYKKWKQYVALAQIKKDNNEHPGPIDNSPLHQTGKSELKEGLLEGRDYKLISQTGWDHLVQWYSLSPEQEPIARKVVEHGLYIKETKVEVYLIELTLSTFRDLERVEIYNFSKANTIADAVEKTKRLFNIDANEDVRVWIKFMSNTYELLIKLENTLQDSSIKSGQMLVLEQKDDKGDWPRQTRSRSLSSSSGMNISTAADSGIGNRPSTISTVSYSPFSSSHGGRQRFMSTKPGLCGLNNIGNTCFMNSTLQCLSNTTPLTKFFLSNTYKHELNPTNPLGMHGNIAEAYADLIHNIWSGQNNSITPRQFKMEVGRFAPRFSGYQQQDSHELLAFLLDGLHEDLNRVKQKPYIELKDDEGRPDEVVAAEAWKNHSKRNDSIIVDYFHGQFKSTVACPVCEKKSVTFDPFCYLSLPLPIKKERNHTITFVSLDSLKKPLRVKVTVPKLGCISDLINSIAKLTGTDPDKLIVTDVCNSTFHKRFSVRDSLSQITERGHIFVYEIPFKVSNGDNEELLVLPVYLREIKKNTHQYSSSNYTHFFGTPLLVPVPRTSTTIDDLYQIILRAMRRFVQIPTPDETEENERDSEKDTEINIENEDEAMEEVEEESDNEAKIKQETLEKEDADDTAQSEKPAKKLNRLFEIKIVNSNGSHDFQTLKYTDKEPIKLNSKIYFAIDWKPTVKKTHYNGTLAKEVDYHPSVHAVPEARKTIQLKDCLELFLQQEKLGEEDPWYCPQCKEHRQAFKKFDLWSLPKILVIHLKRFSYNRYWRDKLDALVNFPITQLDLTDYVINKKHGRAVYDLHAVSNHYGGMGGGHYTAYGINCYDGQWYYFDDSSVSSSDASSSVSKAAYVLFYTRRDDPDNEMMNTSELLTDDPDVFENDGEENM